MDELEEDVEDDVDVDVEELDDDELDDDVLEEETFPMRSSRKRCMSTATCPRVT